MQQLSGRVTFWRVVLVGFIASGAYSVVVRYLGGLGAATHLSDGFPWGMWIGFDVLVGVGLAGGGFATAAAIHLFHLEKYEAVGRPAILTAFLGYALVGVALVLDIGQSWRIWHPVIMWNPHSVMFEVAWCVMLYTTVLALEFSPVVLERFGLHAPLRLIRAVYVPLVIAGVLLSMMHQSSLGSLYLIVPDKLYGLWYTPWLPVFFFVTAVAGGLAMVIVESYLSNRAFGKRLEHELLMGIARAVAVVLALFAFVKTADLWSRGLLPLAFELTTEAVMFWGEMALGVVLPMLLFMSERVRRSSYGLFFAATLTVMGFVVGRLNVAITGMARSSGVNYFPSWQEFAVTASLVAAGFVAFAFAVRYLDLFPRDEMASARAPSKIPAIGLRGMPTANAWAVASLWVLLLLGGGLLFLAHEREAKSSAVAIAQDPAVAAPTRGLLRLPPDYEFAQSGDSPGKVQFSHEGHVDNVGPSCNICHAKGFSLRTTGRALNGEVTMKRMEKGELCGSCHNDKDAFGVTSGCEACHK
jgi:c(7)-type cytochrome triheme protein